MTKKSKHTKKSPAPRSADENSRAVGSVVYEALLLALALELYRDRGKYPKLADTEWSREGQIAMESCLVRCRSLDDFLSGTGMKKENDIYAKDFGYKRSANYRALEKDFRKAINERAAHLTWSRTNAPLPNFQDIGAGFEKYAEYVLAEVFAFVDQVTRPPRSITFVEKRHETYWERLKDLCAKLKPQLAPPPPAKS